MKTLSLVVIAILMSVPIFGNNVSDDLYYWYGSKKVLLRSNPNKKYILFNEGSVNLPSQYKLQPLKISKKIIPYDSNNNPPLYWTIVDQRDLGIVSKNASKIIYEGAFFLAENGKELGLSQLFYVKLKHEKDLAILEKTAAETGTQIMGKNEFMPLWYVLSSSKTSKGDALKMANYFYESGNFSASEPDLMEDNSESCVNDTHLGNQWHLRNNINSGRDVSFCSA